MNRLFRPILAATMTAALAETAGASAVAQTDEEILEEVLAFEQSINEP